MRVRKLYSGNVVYGRLPQGCQLCLRGLKSVIFVTGVCPRDCFYCPLSKERRGRDVIYVNEHPISRFEELVAEVAVSGSRGAGLTGGDPLSRLERTLEIIGVLKSTFGSRFHVHLYTTGVTLNSETLRELERHGLDEMRLHPEFRDLGRLLRLVKECKPSFSVGLEVPVLPGDTQRMVQVLDEIHACEAIEFINLNELEFSESNFEELRKRGYAVAEDGRSAVGSREDALHLIELAKERGAAFSVHFCPASSKDSFQYRLRLYRRGVLTARPHELVSDEGTVLKALVSPDCTSVPPQLLFRGRLGFETSVLLAELVGARYDVIEELPDYRRTLLNII